MAKQRRRQAGRTTRREFLKTVTAAGVGAAASRWFATARPGGVPAALGAEAMRRGGTLKIAEIGEPLTLDTQATTAGLTTNITLPVFEELFAFDANWRIQPSLASGYTISADGLTYTFNLRSNVPFHNGKMMTPDDVIASLNRWGKVSPYGTVPYKSVESVTAAGNAVVMKLTAPSAPLLSFLAFPVGAPAIMPKEIVDATGTGPLKQYIGTGPYKFVEWAPDRYVHLTRFDQYAARSEPGNGMAGRKDALADDIYHYPVSQVATRIAGVQSGDYDIADQVNTDAYAQLKSDPRVQPGIVPGTFLTFFFNKKQGVMANEKLRQAVGVAMDMQPIMQATFGNPDLFTIDASIYPKGTPWYTTAGGNSYNVHNTDQAKQLAKEAGYSGQTIRWLSTQEYDYMFKSTVVASTQLKEAGFNVDLQVVEWATLLDRRSKADMWDMFVTSHSFVPDPSLITVFSSAYPGWWDTPTKNALFAQFNAESDPRKRIQLWAKLQALMYEEVPIVRPGGFSTLLLTRRGLPGFHPSAWIVPWGVQAAK